MVSQPTTVPAPSEQDVTMVPATPNAELLPPVEAGAQKQDGNLPSVSTEATPLLPQLSASSQSAPSRTTSLPAKQRSRSPKLRESSAPPGDPGQPDSKKPRVDLVTDALMVHGPDHYQGIADNMQKQLQSMGVSKIDASTVQAGNA